MRATLRWAPSVAVAAGAAAATAHGLYEVAVASRVPEGIAWLYPVITDGLALVAYASTRRLVGAAAQYAWAVVVLAAVLSGLGQAIYLASDDLEANAVVRFGVGFWPALACALVAHLLHLVYSATTEVGTRTTQKVVQVDEAARAVTEASADEADVETREPVPATDHRVLDLARRLARGEDLTGPAVAGELGLSERTGRRLLGDARSHLEQHQPLHLVTDRSENPA